MAYRNDKVPPQNWYETKQECERWVAERECRPGNCFDGCNWHTCDYRGQYPRTTAKGCAVGTSSLVRFAPGSAELDQPPDWDQLLSDIARLFRVKGRVLRVVGRTSNTEAESWSERRELSQRRAEAVRAALIVRGVAPERLVAEPYEPHLGEADRKPAVWFRADPAYPRREDLNPNSREYRDYCGP